MQSARNSDNRRYQAVADPRKTPPPPHQKQRNKKRRKFRGERLRLRAVAIHVEKLRTVSSDEQRMRQTLEIGRQRHVSCSGRARGDVVIVMRRDVIAFIENILDVDLRPKVIVDSPKDRSVNSCEARQNDLSR